MFKIVWLSLLICSFGSLSTLDMATAIQHLRELDPEMQVLGAAYIQHECYNDSDAKDEVLKKFKPVVGIPLVISSPHWETRSWNVFSFKWFWWMPLHVCWHTYIQCCYSFASVLVRCSTCCSTFDAVNVSGLCPVCRCWMSGIQQRLKLLSYMTHYSCSSALRIECEW